MKRKPWILVNVGKKIENFPSITTPDAQIKKGASVNCGSSPDSGQLSGDEPQVSGDVTAQQVSGHPASHQPFAATRRV